MKATAPDRRAAVVRERDLAAGNFAIADRLEDSAHETVRRLARVYRRAAFKHLDAAGKIVTAAEFRLRHLDQKHIEAYRRYCKQPSAAKWDAYLAAAQRATSERHRYETGRTDAEPPRIRRLGYRDYAGEMRNDGGSPSSPGRTALRPR